MNEFKNIKPEVNIGKSIESLYILKNIFSFLSEKQKLDIIIYNKHLQKIFGVNIKDYIRLSKIYKVGKKNGIGKEFDLSQKNMIFEGEYLNGKRNGKGKEYYYYGKLKIEGEFLNGEKNGKIKEYYDNGNLEF